MKITAKENDTNDISLTMIFIIRLFSTSAFCVDTIISCSCSGVCANSSAFQLYK